MKTEDFNLISAITTSITAVFAVMIGIWQIKINERLRKLQDYVALSIVPSSQGLPQLEIMNVGRSNLYLHKWEIGSLNETFVKPMLLPTDAKSKILIAVASGQIGQHLAKFYLTDESNSKYLSTGEVAIEPVAFQLPISTTPPQTQQNSQNNQSINVQLRTRAWSYKTERYNWSL